MLAIYQWQDLFWKRLKEAGKKKNFLLGVRKFAFLLTFASFFKIFADLVGNAVLKDYVQNAFLP